MKKLTKTEIRKKLQLIENELNDKKTWEIENGCVDYKLSLDKDNNLNFIISCDDDVEENYIIELTEFDVKKILKSIINFVYEEEINYRNNYINKTKNVYKSKAKSIALWLERGNTNRVNKINEELAERYNTTKKMESEVIGYKDYIRDLYNCLSVLCPDWRIEDIKEYCIERFKHFGVNKVEVTTQDNKIVVYYGQYKFNVVIDFYSRKEQVFNKLYNKIKTIQELEENAC